MEINYKEKKIKNIFKTKFDYLIPYDHSSRMPKFSKVVNIEFFLKNISNNKIKNILKKKINFFLKKKINLNDKDKFHNLILKDKTIETLLGDQMIYEYYGSGKIIKILEKRSKKLLKKNKLKKHDLYSLVKVVKNKVKIYKD